MRFFARFGIPCYNLTVCHEEKNGLASDFFLFFLIWSIYVVDSTKQVQWYIQYYFVNLRYKIYSISIVNKDYKKD